MTVGSIAYIEGISTPPYMLNAEQMAVKCSYKATINVGV